MGNSGTKWNKTKKVTSNGSDDESSIESELLSDEVESDAKSLDVTPEVETSLG